MALLPAPLLHVCLAVPLAALAAGAGHQSGRPSAGSALPYAGSPASPAMAPEARAASAPALIFQGDPDRPHFMSVSVTGLDAAALATLSKMPLDESLWTALLSVRTIEALPSDGTYPAVLGSWSVEADRIRFTPRFGIATGVECSARFDGPLFDSLTGAAGAAAPSLEITFSLPEPDAGPSTIVEEIYPTDDVLPENLLRLYIHFSSPMRDQVVHGRVRLLDEVGAEVELPFVEVRRGLWDPGHRRLTLIFHPGRIKRGVGPHEVMGPPLVEGRLYRLVVDPVLIDASGYPLKEGREKIFTVGPADRRSPDPSAWRVAPPEDAHGPLTLEFPEPLDHALLRRMIGVEDQSGDPVKGAIEVGRGERRWSFRPGVPWRPGRYAVVFDPALEDLAGNTPSRLFDVGPGDRPGGGSDPPEAIRMEFTVPPRTP